VQRPQSVRFPARGPARASLGLAAGLTWFVVLLCTLAVIRECWLQPRSGSLLLYAGHPLSPGVEAALTGCSCGFISLLVWLAARLRHRPASRHERFVFHLWWPAVALGISLAFMVVPLVSLASEHAMAVFSAATEPTVEILRRGGHAPSERDLYPLAVEIRRVLPDVTPNTCFVFQRPPIRLRFADGLSFECDPDGRVLRVRRGADVDDEATQRYSGQSTEQIVAKLGRPGGRDVFFDAPWRLLYGAHRDQLAYEPTRAAWSSWIMTDDERLVTDDYWLHWHRP
jgi:hypothetical protein